MLSDFVQSSERIIDQEIGDFDVILGIGTGGNMLGPLLAQKKHVPFLQLGLNDEASILLSDYADDLMCMRVLIVDMNLNSKNVNQIKNVIASLGQYDTSVAGVFVPTVQVDLKDTYMGTSVASMQA